MNEKTFTSRTAADFVENERLAGRSEQRVAGSVYLTGVSTRLLSPKELAAALGVSESSVKRWIDAGRVVASRTDGGHRRVAVADAIRFVRATGTPVLRPDVFGMPEVRGPRPGKGGAEDSLYGHLYAGDAAAARGWILARYLSGTSVAELCDGPIRSALTDIGELWKSTGDGVLIEHRATDACLQALSHLRGLGQPSDAAPTAVVATPEGDSHMLPAFMVATVLGAAGMRAVNLGADTPLSAMQQAVEACRPALVCIGATSPLAPARARAIGRWLGTLPPSVVIVVGGRRREAIAASAGPAVKSLGAMTQLSTIAAVIVARAARGGHSSHREP